MISLRRYTNGTPILFFLIKKKERNRCFKLVELEMNGETVCQVSKFQNIKSEYVKSLYYIKLENLKEIDEFQDSSKTSKGRSR